MMAAIDVVGLSKRYRLGEGASPYGRLTESLAQAFRRRNGHDADDLWALEDVTFSIEPGEVVGVIGRNGAGKTTLLKILARITEPTSGHADVTGRVGSLLEVGIGFHPELTGRENVFLNGAILGMRRAEIRRKFDEIVDFAEIGRFLDTPVKRYSTGMGMRLAFAVAAHLDPEILLVDEVLAVGDTAFQQKCVGKIGDVAGEGRTVLFVSHNMGVVARLCRQALLLDMGRLVASGATEAVIARHLDDLSSNVGQATIPPPREDKGIALTGAAVVDLEGTPRAELDARLPFHVKLRFRVSKPLPSVSIWFRIVNQLGVNILLSHAAFEQRYEPGDYEAVAEVPGELLAPGRYYLDLGAVRHNVETYHSAHKSLAFELVNVELPFESDWRAGVISPRLEWEVTRE